ncbi:MAG: hypothetical protein NVS4B8_15600 [Herpetosiphon sp.]
MANRRGCIGILKRKLDNNAGSELYHLTTPVRSYPLFSIVLCRAARGTVDAAAPLENSGALTTDKAPKKPILEHAAGYVAR